MNAATGILFMDMLIRPFFKVATKFPLIPFVLMFAVYGCIAYIALKSAFVEHNN